MEIITAVCSFLFAVFVFPIVLVIFVSIRLTLLGGSKIGDLSKKYILITGCDSGFGCALAKRLDLIGCHVIATCLTEDGQEKLKAECSSRLITIIMDVSSSSSVEAAKNVIDELLPRPDALWGIVNNAGIMSFAGTLDFESVENMKRVSEVNLWGTVQVTKTFLPYLKKSKGRIVNVNSGFGRLSFPTCSAYCLSKSAVCAFTDCIRLELSLWDISVHLIIPGYFKTEIVNPERAIKQAQHFWDIAPEETKIPYEKEWFKGIWMVTSVDTFATKSIDAMINCMEHAVLSTRPKITYYPGHDSAFFVWWFSLLPYSFTDALIRFVENKRVPFKKGYHY